MHLFWKKENFTFSFVNWNVFYIQKRLGIFGKNSVLDISQGPKYAQDICVKYICYD